MQPPVLITTPTELENLVTQLKSEKLIGIDTESNSMHAFQEQVCLIQFTLSSGDYLVDPLAIDDLSSLGPIFANPKIEMIFHAAEYDLLTLKRDYGFTFSNLFDTMHSARIVGRKRVGLGSLLQEEFDVAVEKKYQRADWGKRPLEQGMIDYARLDTHYLAALREKLSAALNEKERWPIAQEDFARLAKASGTPPNAPEINIWRIKGVDDLTPEQAAVLFKLTEYRHQQAKNRNRPLFKVIGDQVLLTIAHETPQNIRELNNISGISEHIIRRHGKALLAAVRKGGEIEPQFRERRKRPSDDYLNRLDRTKNWRKTEARKIDVESDIVLPKDIMLELVRENPQSPDNLATIMADVPWRLNTYGDQILNLYVKN